MKISGRQGIRWRSLPAVKLMFSMLGKGWNDFYSWMLDRQEKHNTMEKVLSRDRHVPGKDKGLYDISRAPIHAAFLKTNGLKSGHVLLDFGCGYGRTAVAILDYLTPGNYVGVDLSAERIRMCEEYVEREDMVDCKPKFVASKDNSMAYLDDKSIDCVFATSVFSHMPMPQWHEVLAASKRVLKSKGFFILNYHVSATNEPVVNDLKDFYYLQEQVDEAFNSAGFRVEFLKGWHDDLKPENRDPLIRLVKLTPVN